MHLYPSLTPPARVEGGAHDVDGDVDTSGLLANQVIASLFEDAE
jgi:hypothetical protein